MDATILIEFSAQLRAHAPYNHTPNSESGFISIESADWPHYNGYAVRCQCGFDYFIVNIFAKSKQIYACITSVKSTPQRAYVCILCVCSSVGKKVSQNIKSNNDTTRK